VEEPPKIGIIFALIPSGPDALQLQVGEIHSSGAIATIRQLDALRDGQLISPRIAIASATNQLLRPLSYDEGISTPFNATEVA
jgi:hypothetical protein